MQRAAILIAVGIGIAGVDAAGEPPRRPFGDLDLTLPPAPTPPAPVYYRMPPNRPSGKPLALPRNPIKEGDRRTLTLSVHWSLDDGPTAGFSRSERYEIDERIASIRDGREYAASLHVLSARRTDTTATAAVTETVPIAGHYLRLDEPMMTGGGFCFSSVEMTFLDDAAEPSDGHQVLLDFSRIVQSGDRAIAVVQEHPLRVGETIELVPSESALHMTIPTIHRKPDRAGAAHYILAVYGTDHATLVVDPVRGRPLLFRIERADGDTTEIAYRYRD